jgi:hypothetical protein
MVQVIDSQSHLYKKFGLVEKIDPRNKAWQVLVKIGPKSNEMLFNQLKFCTRINSTGQPRKEDDVLPNRVSDYIDEIDDDIGNREGANERHSSRRSLL